MVKTIISFFVLFVFGIQVVLSAEITGRVVNYATGDPVNGVTVRLIGQNISQRTNADGRFTFINVATGKDVLIFSSAAIISMEIPVSISEDVENLGDIKVTVYTAFVDLSPVGIIDEEFLNDDGGNFGWQGINSTVALSNDIYLSSIAYRLSPFRFRVRGYANSYGLKYINGVNFNDQYRGVFNYSSVGALNDLTRRSDVERYDESGRFTYGLLGGSENIDIRAGGFPAGGKVSALTTNRDYRLRATASYSTGMMENRWAFTFGVGGRYSDEGDIEGTFYRNVAYLFSAEKLFHNDKHSISFVTFGSPAVRGLSGVSFQEVYDLTGNNLYNPNWGYQESKKRNSRIVKAYDPTAIISHTWNIGRETSIVSGLGVHFSMYGNTALNWYDGPDPRPDYYRYLPSYNADDQDAFERYTQLWNNGDQRVTQIDWDELYMTNFLSRMSGNGSAIYMVENRRSDLLEATFNLTFNTRINELHAITAGVELRTSRSMQYKTVEDLLGADHVRDIDKFAERDFRGNSAIIMNDINYPNRIAREGDIFGYNFDIDIKSSKAWVVSKYNTRRVEFYYGAQVKYTSFRRNGLMRNGRFPDSSYGWGETHVFIDPGLKANAVFKISGRHFITLHTSAESETPLPSNVYVSPKITDNTVGRPTSGGIWSVDANYIFSMKQLSGRVSFFHTELLNRMERVSYFHDAAGTFVNHILTGVDRRHRGLEFGLKYDINNHWNFTFAGTVAEYIYANNPDGVISYENGSAEDIREKAYLRNYKLGGMPQTAGTFAINWFYNYWFISLYVNGVANNYVEIAPFRRLASNYENSPVHAGIVPTDPNDMATYLLLTGQEKFANAATLDLSIGKIYYLKNRRVFNFNLSVNNLLDDRNIRIGGYESGRLDLNYPDRFRSKYYYMRGINFYLSAGYRF